MIQYDTVQCMFLGKFAVLRTRRKRRFTCLNMTVLAGLTSKEGSGLDLSAYSLIFAVQKCSLSGEVATVSDMCVFCVFV